MQRISFQWTLDIFATFLAKMLTPNGPIHNPFRLRDASVTAEKFVIIFHKFS